MDKKEEIRIRTYQPEDLDRLVAILKKNTPKYFAYEEIDDFIEYINKYIEFYFVIELNDKIAGSGGINISEDKLTGKISWDIIDPDYQHKGLGKKLLLHRIKYILETLKLDRVSVRTSQYAFLFYEKNGFRVINVQKNYWAIGYDLYEMKYEQNL